MDTFSNCQRSVFSLCDLNIYMNLLTCEHLNSIGRRKCERLREEKTPLLTQFVGFQILDWRPQLRSRIQFKKNSEILLLFQNYGIEGAVSHNVFNRSQLLVTKFLFMLTIILSNYQKCPVPLRRAAYFPNNEYGH